MSFSCRRPRSNLYRGQNSRSSICNPRVSFFFLELHQERHRSNESRNTQADQDGHPSQSAHAPCCLACVMNCKCRASTGSQSFVLTYRKRTPCSKTMVLIAVYHQSVAASVVVVLRGGQLKSKGELESPRDSPKGPLRVHPGTWRFSK